MGMEVGLCAMSGTVLGPQHTLSLDIPLWGYDYSHFPDEARREDEAPLKSYKRCNSLYYDYSPKSHSAERERLGGKVGVV